MSRTIASVSIAGESLSAEPPTRAIADAAPAAASPDDGPTLSLPDDRYVPVRPEWLIEGLRSTAASRGWPADQLADSCTMLAARVYADAAHALELLTARYTPFNPDREAIAAPEEPAAGESERGALLNKVHDLLDSANFERLNDVQVSEAIRAANTHGLRVRIDPSRVRHMSLFVRGRGRIRHRIRDWRSPWRGREIDLDVYRRLAVVVELNDDPNTHLKLFREIPIADLEALLPHAEVQMSTLDRVFVVVGGASALGGLVVKLAQGPALGQLFIPAVVALGGLALRGFFGYRRARHRRDAQRTRHLYYKHIASNAAVLHSLIWQVAEEDAKEACLAYAFLGTGDAAGQQSKMQPVREAIEGWLRARYSVHVRFDIDDAWDTLARFGNDLPERPAAADAPPTPTPPVGGNMPTDEHSP